MALLQTGTLGTGSPKMYYELYADNIGASGNNKTIRVTIKVKVNGSSASSFGYAVNWRANIQTPYEFAVGGWQTLKGSEFWNGGQGLRTYSQDITFDGRTASSIACLPGFEISSSGSSWNGVARTSTNFSTASSNTAPYWSNGSVKVYKDSSKSTEYTGYIPENTSSVYITWSGGKDNEGGTLKYGVNKIVNGGSPTTISYPNTGSSYTDNISGISEGGTVRYYVDIRDNHDALSSAIYTNILTKNKLTPATLTSSSSIAYSTTSISFSHSGASNTNGNTTFTYKLSCSEVTVYNPTITGSSTTVTIYKSGTTPTTPYVKFDDIKKKFSSSSYKGNLNFVLTTTNAYGTSKTSTKTIQVDLRTNPSSITCSISGDKSLSTAIKTTADTGNNYFIPNGSDVIRVSWSGGTCNLGSIITYDVQVKIGSGSFITLATGLSSSVKYFDYKCPKQTTSQTLLFRVISRTSFNYTTYKDTGSITLHYYNSPTITIGSITRTDTTATVPIIVKTNSSIPNINTIGSWSNKVTDSTTNLATGKLTQSQSTQNISLSSLTSNNTYTLSVIYNDGTGFSSDKTYNVSIGANLPVLDINKYGIGVNGNFATSSIPLNTKGVIQSTSLTSSKYVRMSVPNDSYAHIITDAAKGLYSGQTLYVKGEIYTGSSYNQKVYHTGNKPTANDVGALALTGGTVTGNTNIKANLSCNYLYINPLKISSLDGSGVNSTSLARMVSSSDDKAGSLKVQLGGTDDKCGFEIIDKNWKRALFSVTNGGEVTFSHREAKSSEIRTYRLSGATGNYRNFIPTVANDGVMEVGKYIDFHDPASTVDLDVRLTAGSGSLVCSGTFTQGSDKDLKENIKYLDEQIMTLNLIDDEDACKKSRNIFKDFIKEQFRPATFNYIGSENEVFGFIAQDVQESEIADYFIHEFEIEQGKNVLAFDLVSYTTVVARALQEEIIEKDNKILELENRLKAIEEKLNINV